MAPKLAIDIHADAADLLSVAITFSNTGNNSVIVGLTGQIIRVWKIYFLVSAATNITFQDGASNTLSGALTFSSNEGIVLDFDTKPWFLMSSGNDFVINQSGTAQVSGTAYYTQA